MKPREGKSGGNPDISIFLSGSGAPADSLLSLGEGGGQLSKGLRQRVNEVYEGRFNVSISHEAAGGASELLLASFSPPLQGSAAPAGPQDDPRALELAPSTRLFELPSDIVVFSVEPEITRPVWRHRKTGIRVFPPREWERDWPADKKKCFSLAYEPEGLVSADRFRQEFARLVAEIKERVGAHIIVFNAFAYDPDDRTRNYFGVQDTPALRALKFNLALIDISTEEGISIVDVDRILAEMGGGAHAVGAFRHSQEACELLRDEFLRIMQEIGFFEHRPLVAQVGRKRK